jgi:hypothetical protein
LSEFGGGQIVSKVLVHVAERAVGWSVAADRLKAVQEKARWTVFALSILGALLAALASQIPTETGSAVLRHAHTALALLGALLLGLATFISSRLLSQTKTAAWVRARAASEALKREAFKFAARVEPYDEPDLAKAEALLKIEYEKVNSAVEKVAHPAADPGRPGSAPRALLTPGEYRNQRVLNQVQKFYRVKAAQYHKTSKTLKRAEFVLAIAAMIVTVIAGALGKTLSVSGVAFDIAALTAVLTTISGTILTHIEASRLDHLVDTYTATARRLEDQDLDFDTASKDPAAWSKFVNRCEEIIAAENASWVAKWAEEKA